MEHSPGIPQDIYQVFEKLLYSYSIAEFLSRDLGKVIGWCDLCGMKLNESKTMTVIVTMSRTMHPQSPSLTISGTVLKESDDHDILRVTFDSKITFENHLRSVSRAASQRLGILRHLELQTIHSLQLFASLYYIIFKRSQ